MIQKDTDNGLTVDHHGLGSRDVHLVRSGLPLSFYCSDV